MNFRYYASGLINLNSIHLIPHVSMNRLRIYCFFLIQYYYNNMLSFSPMVRNHLLTACSSPHQNMETGSTTRRPTIQECPVTTIKLIGNTFYAHFNVPGVTNIPLMNNLQHT